MMHSMIVNWDTDILFNGGLLQLGLDSKDLWVLVLASLVLLAVSIMQECVSKYGKHWQNRICISVGQCICVQYFH